MRRVSNFQWFFILAICALIVFLVGAVSLHLKINLPDLLPEDLNDSSGTWAFAAFWLIHAPLIFILSRRFSFERRRLAGSLSVFLPAGIIWAMLVQGIPLLFLPVLNESVSYNSEPFRHEAINWFGSNFIPNTLIYWSVLSISLLSSYYERYQNEKLKASQLDAQLSNARLQALQMQMHPHFLFNTLHSVSAMVLANETRDAVKMINRLSELLRLTLDRSDMQIVTLEDEIELTRRYLEIECIRFQDRLTVDVDIDPQASSAGVPTLILQPLVENAMRHAVDFNAEESRVQITAHLQNGRILIEVRDDGKDLQKISGQIGASGLGIKNTCARLAELYGEDYSFSLSRSENEWTIAQIVIPFLPVQQQMQGEPN